MRASDGLAIIRSGIVIVMALSAALDSRSFHLVIGAFVLLVANGTSDTCLLVCFGIRGMKGACLMTTNA
jgi:hypothetical protein